LGTCLISRIFRVCCKFAAKSFTDGRPVSNRLIREHVGDRHARDALAVALDRLDAGAHLRIAELVWHRSVNAAIAPANCACARDASDQERRTSLLESQPRDLEYELDRINSDSGRTSGLKPFTSLTS
jgi:hypothetical protein